MFATCPTIRYSIHAAVAKLADARDLKSLGVNPPYRFESGQRHHKSDLLYRNGGAGLIFYISKSDFPFGAGNDLSCGLSESGCNALSDLIFIILVDKIINTRTIDTCYFLSV